MAWDPVAAVVGDRSAVTVSATDVGSTAACGRHLALKVRRGVKLFDGWGRSFGDVPFVLATVNDLVLAAHGRGGLEDYPAHRAWLRRQMDLLKVHRALRPFVEHAVDTVLEAHELLEGETGPVRLLRRSPEVGRSEPPRRLLTVWGPLYETDDGVREVRRLRVGRAKTDGDPLWNATAAFVAAMVPGNVDPTRVRVTEVGCLDGSTAVQFDGTVAEARALYDGGARARASALVDEDHVAPCRSCGDCKAAGSCGALAPVDGALGQDAHGLCTRSVSPTDLRSYDACPAQWLLHREAKLPNEASDSPRQAVGSDVHLWLEAAHRRGVGCEPGDLPAPGAGDGPALDVLTQERYAAAHPYLVGHPKVCPLNVPGATLVAVEETLSGFDHTADVVLVMRPDLVVARGGDVVVREFKTADQPYLAGAKQAFDTHLQVAFGLAMLRAGLTGRLGGTAGVFEVEVMVPGDPAGHKVYEWRTDKPGVGLLATEEVSRIAAAWHVDATWETRPGPHCGWCPVRRWCPDRDVWASPVPTADSGPGVPDDGARHEEPPF